LMIIQISLSLMTSIKQTFSFRTPQHSGAMLTLPHYVVCGILGPTKSKFLSVMAVTKASTPPQNQPK
jgi:hypothetical protein